MKAVVDCIPCVFLQALNTSKRIITDEKKLAETQYKLMELVSTLSLDMTPAELSYHILKETCELLGDDDPFRADKQSSNDVMLSLYTKMEKIAEYSTDKKYTALKIAAAANTIDLGILTDFDVSSMITKVLEESFRVDDYEKLAADIDTARNVLYLADNAGEIVGDKLFIGTLDRDDVTVAVKGKPILNDATLDDAEQIGLRDVARVVSTGSGMLGTIVSDCSDEFVGLYNDADLIVSKGQANFESLEGVSKSIYFILTAKCGPVAERLGVKTGDAVVVKGIPETVRTPKTTTKTAKER